MDLEKMMEEYNKQLEQEFTFDPKDTSAVDMSRKIRNSLIPLQPTFLSQLARLATNAKSESVRLQAIKFGIEAVFGKNVIHESESDLDKLISDLQGNPSREKDYEKG